MKIHYFCDLFGETIVHFCPVVQKMRAKFAFLTYRKGVLLNFYCETKITKHYGKRKSDKNPDLAPERG